VHRRKHRQKTQAENTGRKRLCAPQKTQAENTGRKHRQKTQAENTGRKHRQKLQAENAYVHRRKHRQKTQAENTCRKHRQKTQAENAYVHRRKHSNTQTRLHNVSFWNCSEKYTGITKAHTHTRANTNVPYRGASVPAVTTSPKAMYPEGG